MKKFGVLILFALVAIFVQVVYGVTLFYTIGSDTGRGTFGDMFGAVNAFFTGLTLAGLIYTIHEQQKDMESAREATNRSITAQENAAKALKKQADLLHRTAALNAYSIMISSYNHLIQEMQGFDVVNNYKQEREVYIKKLKEALDELQT
jgi:uncharacterized protein YPO0396